MRGKIVIILCVRILTISYVKGDVPCASRLQQDYESPLCVCNSTYCDQISKIIKQPRHYLIYTTTKSGLRFQKRKGKLIDYQAEEYGNTDFFAQAINFLNLIPKTNDIIFKINRNNKRQYIEGFGGAFTDSAAINYKKLSEKTQKKLIMSYFSKNGIEYNLGRVPIGGSDFSTHPYTYNMFPENDATLSNFSLTEEDLNYKIPFIKAAQEASNDKMKLIGAAWSPPLWMKTSHEYTPPGLLLDEYYQTWADYHLKFLKEYEKLGLLFWGLSTGNEPVNGIFGIRKFISLGWFPHKQVIQYAAMSCTITAHNNSIYLLNNGLMKKSLYYYINEGEIKMVWVYTAHSGILTAQWIADNFGPTIKSEENYPNIKILAGDENRHSIPAWLLMMSFNQKAMSYIDGMSFHWYANHLPSFLNDIFHFLFKDVFLIASEACRGSTSADYVVALGSWDRAESYIRDIIDELNHWSVGWLDWNLLLDQTGGPNWYGNVVDAPIIINEETDEFVKQPMFYSMGHISKFIPRESIKIDLDQVSGPNIDKTAFLRPDGGITVVFYNGHDSSHNVTIKENRYGQMSFEIPPYSINSVVYW